MIAPLPIILEGTQEAKDHIAARIQRRKEWLIGGWKMEVVGRPSMSGTVIFDAHGNYVGMDKPYAAKPDIFFTKGKWDLRSYDVIEFNRTGTTGKNIKSRLTFESDDQSSFSAKISPLNSKGSVQTFSRPTRVNGKKIKTREETAAENMQASQLFLEQNKSQPGVLTTSTGLQYRVKAEGTGKSPAIDDTVKVHYRGKLISGKEFDSSYSKGKPVSFVVKQVVKGWVEGLQLMREGSNYELFIPPDLGYGKGGAGKVIGPNEALIFEIELLSVE
jgi:FKBP-type peptidyl-prolyl cis-trans isomerase